MPPKDFQPLQVLIVGASLRRDSFNNRLASLAAQAVKHADSRAELTTIADFDCPSYDGDVEVESGIPEPAKQFCQRLKASDALMIASPEYNASIPGALKNLIDWVSRFRPQPFNGKQVLLMSASPAMAGGNRGALVASRSARAPRRARLSRHVLPRAGARGVHRRLDASPTTCSRSASTTRSAASSSSSRRRSATRRSRSSGWSSSARQPDAAIDRVETSEVTAA